MKDPKIQFRKFLGAQNLPLDLWGVSRTGHQIFRGCPESIIRFSGGVVSLASVLLTDQKYSPTLVPEGLQKGNQKKVEL